MNLHFVTDTQIVRFVEQHTAEDIDRQHQLFTNSSWAWIVQTALLIRSAGFAVSLSNDFEPRAINLALADQLRRMPRRSDIFVVSIDADQLRPRWVNLSIVQNQRQTGRSAYWIPHWPQPGLIPRSPERQTFSHVGFFGLTRHLYRNENWWHKMCGEYGMQFSVRPPKQWHDYSDVDIAIGIRNMSRKRFHEKPPTKLFNAWLAGVVFIGGIDSAYSQVGVTGQDYLVAEDEKTLIDQLGRLQRDAALGSSLILAGQQKTRTVGSRASTLQAWIELMEQHIIPKFEQWHTQSSIRKHLAFSLGICGDAAIRGRNELWRRFKRFRQSHLVS